jgi:hypothetical protein
MNERATRARASLAQHVVRNVRVTEASEKDDRVHLPGNWHGDFSTLCGYVWMQTEETSDRVTCKSCIIALDHSRKLIRSARRLLPRKTAV